MKFKLFLLLFPFISMAMDKGLYLTPTIWTHEKLRVCWENPLNTNQSEREWVQKAIENSWGKHTPIKFLFWKNCSDIPFSEVRIEITDAPSTTQGLGKDLFNVRAGVNLNFNFKTWNRQCRENEEKRKSCVESIAIHEFGHVLGLAHEHNRKDRAADCKMEPQGSIGNRIHGVFDRDSIMNYCYQSVLNNKLSEGDIATIQEMYGPPND